MSSIGNNLEYSLFNTSDEWIIHYVDDTVFDESLLLNILFQDRILMHESYFFNSSLLAKHISKSRTELSLFEYAVKRGLIIPAMRDDKAQSLEEAYHFLHDGKFYNSFNLLIPELKPFKDRIIGAIDAGLVKKKQKPFHWPKPSFSSKSLGEQYLDLIREKFQHDDISHFGNLSVERELLFQRIWEKTKSLRFDCIEKAAEKTKQNGNLGIQRIELIRHLGWELGIPDAITTIVAGDVINQCSDPEKRLAVEIFIKWLAECHHLIQAKIFRTSISFPVYDLDEDFLLDTITPSFQKNNSNSNNGESLKTYVTLPPMEAMIELEPEEIVAIRDDLGDGYRVALKRWQNNPSNDNREQAASSLKDYCSRISQKYERKYLEPLIVTFCNSKSMGPITKNTSDVVSKTIPGSGLLISCSKLVYTTYQYFSRKKIKARLMPRSQELEINLTNSNLMASNGGL